MSEVLSQLKKMGIVPVVKLDKVEDAIPLAKALCDGGLPCAEVTYRTDAAEESIRVITKEYPNMLVGAGTVLTIEQVDSAVAAGAKFIVSPGLNPKVVKHCLEIGVPITPGCANPSDIEQALELGLDLVKIFPAESIGGLSTIKAMAAPYVNMRFMPTGGINAKNINSYLEFPKIIACGGSWMVKEDLVNAGDFNKIKELTKEAVATMLDLKLGHVGINGSNEKEADSTAQTFEKIFGFSKKVGSSSIFAGKGIEITKEPYLGKNGHIAIQTNSVERAVFHLEMQGVKFDKETIKYDEKENMKAIYLEDEIGGFAVHLLQK